MRAAVLAAAFMVAAIPAWGATHEAGFERIIRLDNDDVQVVELIYGPGSVSPLHTHEFPRRVIYVIAGGVLDIIPGRKLDDGGLEFIPGGAIKRITVTPGQTLWLPSQTHALRNGGETPVRVIEVEVKNAAP